jgi:thiamine-monophosphate kinase
MMDCSDGLATDLRHICRASGVSARVGLERLPVDPAVRDAADALGADALAWATSGGEDFELLLTCDPASVEALREGLLRATGTTLTVLGEIEEIGAGVTFLNSAGTAVPVAQGYEHFRA